MDRSGSRDGGVYKLRNEELVVVLLLGANGSGLRVTYASPVLFTPLYGAW